MSTPEHPLGALELALMAAAFMAAALGLEGLALLWHQTRSPAMLRLQRRLHDWFPEDAAPAPWWSRTQAAWRRWRGARGAHVRAAVQQLPDGLDLMARALRSGHAFSTALQMVAEEGPQPLAAEMQQVVEHMAWGGDPGDALDALAHRLPVDEVRFFVMAVKLQRQTGGQLAEVLGNIAQLLRQREQLVDKVRVLTAEGRLSAQVLSALPPLTAAALWMVRPEFMALLWTDPLGLQMLQASAGLMVLGSVWLWRMTQIQV